MMEGIITGTSLLSIVGILVSAAISYIIACKGWKKNSEIVRNQLSVQYITDKRTNWIQEVRTLLAEYMAYCLEYAEYVSKLENRKTLFRDSKSRLIELHSKINLKHRSLLLYLNRLEETGSEVLNQLSSITSQTSLEYSDLDYNKFLNDISLLTNLSQDYLKAEWERCKHEVGNDTLCPHSKNAILADGVQREEAPIMRTILGVIVFLAVIVLDIVLDVFTWYTLYGFQGKQYFALRVVGLVGLGLLEVKTLLFVISCFFLPQSNSIKNWFALPKVKKIEEWLMRSILLYYVGIGFINVTLRLFRIIGADYGDITHAMTFPILALGVNVLCAEFSETASKERREWVYNYLALMISVIAMLISSVK